MSEKNQKLLFKISALSIVITTIINVWMQATTGNVNGSLFGPIALICCSIVVLTVFFVEIFTPSSQKVKGITKKLLLLIIGAIVISQIAEKAKLIYEIQLKAEHPDLFKEYNNIQNTKSNKDLKRIFLKG